MDKAEVRVGDVVAIASHRNTDPMTVVNIFDDGTTKCAWFDMGTLRYELFPRESLVAASPKPG